MTTDIGQRYSPRNALGNNPRALTKVPAESPQWFRGKSLNVFRRELTTRSTDVRMLCMSARKIDGAELFQPVTLHSQTTRLDLAASAITFRKNGIEFRSNEPIPAWTEMTVSLQTPADAKRFNCTGVVVSCSGSRHTGYTVSMVFTNLTRQAQLRLHNLAYSPLA
jgi:hypothetical protein